MPTRAHRRRKPSPINHEGLSRKRADAKRDGHSEAAGTGSPVCGSACPQQYVEGLNGETARHSRVSALVAEAS